jgi:hypothetical protein
MTRAAIVIPVAAVALALTACSGSNDSARAPTAPPTAVTALTTTAPPTTTQAPTTTAGEVTPQDEYFVISGAANAVGAHAERLLDKGGTIKASTVKKYCAMVAASQAKFANDIEATTWPAHTQDQAAALVAAVAADAGVLNACAQAPTNAMAIAILARHDFSKTDDAASAFGLAIGTPVDR